MITDNTTNYWAIGKEVWCQLKNSVLLVFNVYVQGQPKGILRLNKKMKRKPYTVKSRIILKKTKCTHDFME